MIAATVLEEQHLVEPGPDLFLSYAREDEARARELATALDQRGFSVFWDREIPPGHTWHSYMGKSLTKARCVVVAWSRHSIASQWVLEEASEGRDRKVLVPVLFEAVPPPFGFRSIQPANLTDWRPDRPAREFDGLLASVQRIIAEQAGSGTGAEALSTSQPAPSEPETKARSSVTSLTPPPTRDRRAEPVTPPNRRAGAWSRLTLLAIVVAFIGLAGAGGGMLWWLPQPEPTSESKPGVHAQIFTHNVGLTEQDAIGLKTLLEGSGIPTSIYVHKDRRAPDAAFIGALVTAEKGQIALSAAPYDIRYLFPPDYSEVEGDDPSGFTIGLGYMSTHNKQSRKSEPVEISKSDLSAVLEHGISNVEFQRRLARLYDRAPPATPPAEAEPGSR